MIRGHSDGGLPFIDDFSVFQVDSPIPKTSSILIKMALFERFRDSSTYIIQ